MSKSAPSTSAAQLRLSSSRAVLANWPEPTQKWGQVIKLFMTRLCCKHTHTVTNWARRWSMLMCVLCGLSAFSLHTSLFLFSSAFAVLLSLCPLSLYVRVMSDLFLQCDAQRKWEASPGQEHATRTHSWANMLCACVEYSRNSLCWYFHLKSI